MNIPFHDTMEASVRVHDDAGRSQDPTTPQKSAKDHQSFQN